MTILSLKFLGSLDVFVGDAQVTNFRSAKVEALLAYLAMEQKRPLRRDALVALLWPNEPLEAARANLRQSISRLQKGINNQEATPPYLHIAREVVQFNCQSRYELDVQRFQSLLTACPEHRAVPERLCPVCVGNWQTAVSLYKGDFLAHFFIDDSPVFEQWLLTIREHLHQQALAALQWLANYHEDRGEYDQALAYARRQTALEPWREEPYQQQMRLLARQGARATALALYETCRQVLHQELGVEPTPAMVRLYQRIQTAPAERPHNLPHLPRSFVGRQEEMAQLLHYLVQPERRLVTLLGPGGIGKTSLALHVGTRIAREYLGPFADGLYVVSLAGITEPPQMVLAIANALGIGLKGNIDPMQQMLNSLKQKELLLLLDNFEQLGAAGTAVVVALLAGTTAVKCLVTSRQRLNLRGEWLVAIGGLPYPHDDDPDGIVVPEHVDPQQYEAMQLFIDRARQTQPGQSIGQGWEDKLAIVRICQMCEGMPLALELAAAWVGMLTCGEIAAEIGQSLDLLRTDYHDVDLRHRSLQVVFDHSWALLSATERAVLAQLSVFQGGFSREAAAEVAAASLVTLRQLVDKSLLRQVGASRFALHELLRQFAGEKLAERGETAVVQHRHAAYFADLVQQQKGRWATQENQQAVAIIRADIQNVRTGWYWTAVQRDVALLDQYLHGMLNFYALVSWYQEAQQAFELCALSLADENLLTATDNGQTAHVYARILSRQAGFCYRLGNLHKTVQLARQSIDLLANSQAFAEQSYAYQVLGMAYHQLGVFDKAQEAYYHGYEASLKTEDEDRKANLGLRMGEILFMVGAYPEAERWLQVCLRMYEASGKVWGIAESTRWLGEIAYAQGAFAVAEKLFQQSLVLYEEIGNSSGIAHCSNQLGKLTQQRQDLAGAEARFAQSLAIYQENGEEMGLADTLNNLGDLARMAGAYEEARQYLGEALQRAATMDAAPLILQTLTNTADLLVQTHARLSVADVQVMVVSDNPAQLIKAHDVLSLVVSHPAASHLVRRRAEQQLEDLRATLPPRLVRQLAGRQPLGELKQVIAGVLATDM